MKHLLLFLLAFTLLLYAEEPEELILSTPQQIASLTYDSNHLIAGVISPLSGMPILRVTDLIAPGAQPIILSRSYFSPYMPVELSHEKHHSGEYEKKHLHAYLLKHYKGWHYLPHLILEYFPRKGHVRLADASGITLDFQLTDTQAILLSAPYAMSNLSGESPSGRYDLRNTQIFYEHETIIVKSCEGVERHYKQRQILSERTIYLLHKEILTNGKCLKYDYNSQIRITAQDKEERFTYATITINSSKESVECTSSSGAKALYHYTQNPITWHIKGKTKKGKFEQKTNGRTPLLLTSVTSPFFASESMSYCDRALLADYRSKDLQCGLHHSGFGQERHYRVDQLFLPVGEKDTFISAYTFDYQPAIPGSKEGKTIVTRLDGLSTIYHFSKNLLLTRVQTFEQEQLKQEKLFTWTENNYLASIELKDGSGHLFHKKKYEYDNFGNPILEQLTGDLTGSGKVEIFSIHRSFTIDGSNLLLFEEEEEGKTTVYTYLSGTHLLTAKYIKENGHILQRTFYNYDPAYNLIETIHDDGNGEDQIDRTGVTQRIVTEQILRQEEPHLHMPEWIIESYEENGALHLLQKRHLLYDKEGHLIEEEIYGSDAKHAYTLYKTYNERGDLLTKTNPAGDLACFAYDAHGRCISESNFSARLYKTSCYDVQGRKTTLQENERQNSFVYDPYHRCLSKTNPFGHTTHYTHTFSQIQEHFASTTTSRSFDPLGRKEKEQDANGNVTHYRYNAYGSPSEIHYADGSKESFRYSKDGHLISHTTKDGPIITYTRDIFGRILTKDYHGVAREQFTYNAFHLLFMADKEEHIHAYQHDGAGRKTSEEFCGQITHFSYDNLGELATVQTGDLITCYTRDLQGRITQEQKKDHLGNLLYTISYSYDKDGNQTTIKRTIQNREAIHTFDFDPFGRCIKETDALGHITHKHYDEDYVNSAGEDILRVVTTDPLKKVVVEDYDPHSRLIKREQYTPKGDLLSAQEFTHDPHGNLLLQQEHLYAQGAHQSTQTIHYTYTFTNQIQSCSRNQERTTWYTYFPSGKLQSKTLPSGVGLQYAYHPLGCLSRIDSSDHTICHTFVHNRLGDLTYAYDQNQNIRIQREVDPFGNILSETLPNGFKVEKSYDRHNRLTKMTLPDGHVEYLYDPLYLRAVTRTSSSGESYTHSYTSYDLAGNLLLEKLPGELGDVMHLFNPNAVEICHKSPYFSEYYQYNACGDVTDRISDQEHTQYTYDPLSQLTSENGFSYAYDSLYNRTHKNGTLSPTNALNELYTEKYDLNGCQTSLNNYTLSYDHLNRLISAYAPEKQIDFIYDPLGRCLSKTVSDRDSSYQEHYLYDGNQEMGTFDSNNHCKNLRILANGRTIAIELSGRTFLPLHDNQNSIRRLIDLETRRVVESYDFSSFGEPLKAIPHGENPWRYASKRLDPDLHLLNFGARFYDMRTGRWLTPDPAGFYDSTNLYQYVFNNPFKYTDPNGEFAFLIPLLLIGVVASEVTFTGLTVGAAVAQIAGTLAAGWAAYEINRVQTRVEEQIFKRDAYKYAYEDYYAKNNKPPYDGKELGFDPTKCPGEGFEWKGNGPPEGGQGNWVRGEGKQKETLHPDLKHPLPKKPHWDYTGPEYPKGARLNTDGTWEVK